MNQQIPVRRSWGLIAVVVLALTVITISIVSDDTQSSVRQDPRQTWHLVDMETWRSEGVGTDRPATGQTFIEQLPAHCDLILSPHSDTIFYYSCPMDWEPTPDI